MDETKPKEEPIDVTKFNRTTRRKLEKQFGGKIPASNVPYINPKKKR